jgi:hypothetical protein
VIPPRAARAVRGLWPDRNPLRRSLDRAEAAVVGGLVVIFLAGAPLAALTAGHTVYRSWSRTAHAQQVAGHRVPAVLLAAVPRSGSGNGQVPAWWTAPDGTRRTGDVPAPAGTRAGSTIMVWVDEAGRLTGRPLQRWEVQNQAALAAMLAPIAVGLVVLGIGQLAHGWLRRRRLAAWDADWRATEPQWTGRR